MAWVFTEELDNCLTEGLASIFDWIHGAGGSADAPTAKAVAKAWLDANYEQFATQKFAYNIIDRVLPVYDEADGWVAFRDKTAAYRSSIRDVWVREVINAANQ